MLSSPKLQTLDSNYYDFIDWEKEIIAESPMTIKYTHTWCYLEEASLQNWEISFQRNRQTDWFGYIDSAHRHKSSFNALHISWQICNTLGKCFKNNRALYKKY